MFERRSLLLGAFVLFAVACSDGPAGLSDVDPSVELAVVSGNGQSAPAGTELSQPLVAEVTANGVPLADVVVNFRVVSGGGRAFAGVARTDAQGRARDFWTLGPVAGAPQLLEVRAVRAGQKQVYASFTATALPPVPASDSAH